MSEAKTIFTDGEAYEQFMGRWSRAVGQIFLEWLAAPKGLRWLDVGCGTGVFTELIVKSCDPASVTAVDPSDAQVNHAKSLRVDSRVDYQVGDAQSLAFSDGSFDVVTSALVLNFVPDRRKAMSEMRRVCAHGGIVAAYVWDFDGEHGSSAPIWQGLKDLGSEVADQPGKADTKLDVLEAYFENVGLRDVESKIIDVTQTFASFDEYWKAQTPSFNIIGKIVDRMPDSELKTAKEKIRATVDETSNGEILVSSRAHAVKGQVR